MQSLLCGRSSFFLTTHGPSSMSGMVMQERHAHGVPVNTTLAFEMLGTLDPLVWRRPWAAANKSLDVPLSAPKR